MANIIEDIILFDMDGTICDYDLAMSESLEELRSPSEPVFNSPIRNNSPDYIKARANLIKQSEDWWANLPKLKLGWDILEVAESLGYKPMILTQAPRTNPKAAAGKLRWLMKNLSGVDFTMTRDKGLVYGKALVDDFIEYVERWLTHRPRGQVIMPASQENLGYSHPQVVRYDGTNIAQVIEVLKRAKERKY